MARKDTPKKDDTPVVNDAEDTDDADDIEDLDDIEVVVEEIDPVIVLEELVDDEVIEELDDDLDEEDDDDDEEEEAAVVVAVPIKEVRRPATSQRSPMGKDEPPPPFAIGEPVILTQNTRPRTGTPVGNYAVGTHGVVEAVLSLTAVVRFDVPPYSKEVVAFTCLTSALKQKTGKAEPDDDD